MKSIFKVTSLVITFNLMITGCSSTQKEVNTNGENEKAKSICEKYTYLGKIPTGMRADIEQGSPTIINFTIGDKSCTAISNSKANYQIDKISLNFDSITCEGNKEIKVKGQILDKDCMPGINAKHIINSNTVKYLEEKVEKYPLLEYKKELLNAKMGYLETEPNMEVFIQITEPFYFMHKDQIHKFGY